MSEIRELIDAELDAVCGGHHGHHHGHYGNQGLQGSQGNQEPFGFGNFGNLGNTGNTGNTSNIGNFSLGDIGNFSFGNIVNFGNIVIEPIIAVQIGVAVGSNASVTNSLSQLNISSIGSDPLSHLAALQAPPSGIPLGAPPH